MTGLAARESGESDILHLNIRRCVLPLKRRGRARLLRGLTTSSPQMLISCG